MGINPELQTLLIQIGTFIVLVSGGLISLRMFGANRQDIQSRIIASQVATIQTLQTSNTSQAERIIELLNENEKLRDERTRLKAEIARLQERRRKPR